MAGPERALVLIAALKELGPDRIVLGGRFGEEPAELSWHRLDGFAAAGGRFVDTAYSYANGESERVIGQWLRANSGALHVIDKVGHPDRNGRVDLGPDNITREVAESTRRLGVERIAVVLLHRDARHVRITDIASSLIGLVSDGYAGQIGVSNLAADRLEQLTVELADRGHVPVVSYQRSLAVPHTQLWAGALHADTAVQAVVERHGLVLLAWAAQARGYFTGRTELVGPGQEDAFDTTQNTARRLRCRQLAEDVGVRPETVALAWLLHQPNVMAIVGPRSIEELDASLAAARLPLDPSTCRWLAEGTR